MHSWHISSSLIFSFKERVHIVAKVKIKHLSVSCQSILEQSVLRRLNVMFFTKLKAFSKPHKNDFLFIQVKVNDFKNSNATTSAQLNSLRLCKTHLVSLVADGHAISAVHDVVFTVVPQQAVGDRAEELLRPPGHLVPVQSRLAAHFVHVVDQDLRSVGKIGHTVHSHAGNFADDAQQQAVICDHLGNGRFVLGDDRQDVRDEMSDAVVSEVDAEMSKQRPGHFQQIATFVKGQVVFGVILLPLFGRRKEKVEQLV